MKPRYRLTGRRAPWLGELGHDGFHPELKLWVIGGIAYDYVRVWR